MRTASTVVPGAGGRARPGPGARSRTGHQTYRQATWGSSGLRVWLIRDSTDASQTDGAGRPAPLDERRFSRHARQVCARLLPENITKVYSAPDPAALDTCAALCSALGLTPVVDGRLGNPSLVGQAGLGRTDGGRTGLSPHLTAVAALEEVAGAHLEGSVAVAATSAAIDEVLTHILGVAPQSMTAPEPASLTQLAYRQQRWHLRSFNETSHLEP